MNQNPPGVGPGWLADPLGEPGRLRWWDGGRWTARVAPLGDARHGLAWRPELAVVGPPQPEPDSEAPVRIATPTTAATPPAATPPAGPDPLATSGAVAPWPVSSATEPRFGLRRRHVVTALAAGAVLTLGAGAGAGILGDGGRPELDPTRSFRDESGDFALRYPDTLARQRRARRAALVRFIVGDDQAPTTLTNTVTVSVGAPTDSPLPRLEALATNVADMMRADFPGIELEEASDARLLGAPARRAPADTTPARTLRCGSSSTSARRPPADRSAS